MNADISFVLNNQLIQPNPVNIASNLLDFLRLEKGLCATKEGCAEGDCGACTVLLGDVCEQHVHYHAVNACLILVGQVAGRAVMTLEGLKDGGNGLHPIQQAMVDADASQCGFCTPGFVMALAALAQTSTVADNAQIHNALAGNLCRCTGYKSIVSAAKQALGTAVALDPQGVTARALTSAPATPPAFERGAIKFYFPKDLPELCDLLTRFPNAALLAGGTDLGLDLNKGTRALKHVIVLRDVVELNTLHVHEHYIEVGACVTLTRLSEVIAPHYPSFARLLDRFGSPQIRNLATLGGNVATASPIGDSLPCLLALDATITLTSSHGKRDIPANDFFVDYRKTALRQGEIVERIRIPLPAPATIFNVYKISKRYDQDISTLCAAFAVTLDEHAIITDARIAMGGVAATAKRVQLVENMLVDKSFDQTTIDAAAHALQNALSPVTDWRGSAAYRNRLAGNLLKRFHLQATDPTTPVEVVAL